MLYSGEMVRRPRRNLRCARGTVSNGVYDVVVLAGGEDDASVFADVDLYLIDANQGNWVPGPPLPEPRSNGALVNLNGR